MQFSRISPAIANFAYGDPGYLFAASSASSGRDDGAARHAAGFRQPNGIRSARPIQVSFLSLNTTGSYSQEIDPLHIEIEGENIPSAGLDLEAASNEAVVSPNGGESSLAPAIRAAIVDAANGINGLLPLDKGHTKGPGDSSPVVPRPPAGAPAASIHEVVQSLTKGFTPRIRLHP